LTAAPAVQRYLAAPAEAILALPIKNQQSTIVTPQSLPHAGGKRFLTTNFTTSTDKRRLEFLVSEDQSYPCPSVKFDEGLEIVSSSMSAALPLWLKNLHSLAFTLLP
jgi:hypothetical protein